MAAASWRVLSSGSGEGFSKRTSWICTLALPGRSARLKNTVTARCRNSRSRKMMGGVVQETWRSAAHAYVRAPGLKNSSTEESTRSWIFAYWPHPDEGDEVADVDEAQLGRDVLDALGQRLLAHEHVVLGAQGGDRFQTHLPVTALPARACRKWSSSATAR